MSATDHVRSSAGEVCAVLEGRPGDVCFVSGIAAVLARRGVDADGLERALVALQRDGLVLVRSHSCGDPHLADVDLRIAARTDPEAADPVFDAVQRIEATWSRWVARYRANHVCS